LAEALTKFGFEYDFGDRDRASRELAAIADQYTKAARTLRDQAMANTALQAEAAPWLAKFAAGADALAAVSSLAVEGRLENPEAAATVQHHLNRLSDDRYRVFGDVLEMFLAELVARMNDTRQEEEDA
jgi:hypothetical protein